MYVYREEIDNLDMNAIVKEFIVRGDEKRQNIFIPPSSWSMIWSVVFLIMWFDINVLTYLLT